MYSPKEIVKDPTLRETFENKPSIHRLQSERWGGDQLSWPQWQRIIAKYKGYVSLLDELIGRLLAALKEEQLVENTLVVFSADHGDTCGSRRTFDKGYTMYDELYRIPMIMRWPTMARPGSVNQEFAHLHDLMPTFLESAGCEIPPGLDSRSLVPLLTGNSPANWPDSAFCEFSGMQWGLYTQRMIRTRTRKLVYNGSDIGELYDLENDPYELVNRFNSPEYADDQRLLSGRLFERMRVTNDPLSKDIWVNRAHNPHWAK